MPLNPALEGLLNSIENLSLDTAQDPAKLSQMINMLNEMEASSPRWLTTGGEYERIGRARAALQGRANQIGGEITAKQNEGQALLNDLSNVNYGGKTNFSDLTNVGNASDRKFLQDLQKNQQTYRDDISGKISGVNYSNRGADLFAQDKENVKGLKDYLGQRYQQDQTWQNTLANARANALSGKLATKPVQLQQQPATGANPGGLVENTMPDWMNTGWLGATQKAGKKNTTAQWSQDPLGLK